MKIVERLQWRGQKVVIEVPLVPNPKGDPWMSSPENILESVMHFDVYAISNLTEFVSELYGSGV